MQKTKYKFFEDSLEDRIFEALASRSNMLVLPQIVAQDAFTTVAKAQEVMKKMYDDGQIVRQKVKISRLSPVFAYGLEFNEVADE